MTSMRAPASEVSGAYRRVSSNASETTAPGSRLPRRANQPPSPYTSARARAETSVRAVMNADCAIAVRTPMSRTRRARAANSADSSSGPPEELDERGAGRGEPLGHPGAHRRVQVRRLPLQACHPAARPPCGHHEQRQQHQREQGDLPGQGEHDGEGEQQRDEIADDSGQRVAEGALAPITSCR